jgi:hypothetical protein
VTRNAVAVALALGLAAACAAQHAHPPELGDCVADTDASCSTPVSGGSAAGGRGGADAGDAGDGAAPADGGACGMAESLVVAQAGSCHLCIEASCCLASQACSNDAACLALLQCAVGCPAGDTSCAAMCESLWPGSVTAYHDLIGCLRLDCKPQCPTPPQAVGSE